MKAVLLLVSFVLVACSFAQGFEEKHSELDGVASDDVRIKRNAQPITKKKKSGYTKSGKPKTQKRNKEELKPNKNKNKKKPKGKNGSRKRSRRLRNRKRNKGQKKNDNKKSTSGQKKRRNRIKRKNKRNRPNQRNTQKDRSKKRGKGHVKKTKGDKAYKGPTVRQSKCGDADIMNDKILRIKQMDNRMRQAKRADRFHKVIGNKCSKAPAYTVSAKRFEDAITRAGGKENCETDPTADLTALKNCEAEVCKICSSPLSSEWQTKYKECDTSAKAIKNEVENALTCDAIKAANEKAKAKNTECGGPLANTTSVKTACAKKNKECKDLKDAARGIEVNCKAPVDLESANSTVDETQENRTSVVEAALDTFINGTGDLLNNLGLSTGEGSDGTISADAQAVAANITRSDTISASPTCNELISYSAGLIDFSDAAETQDTLSEEQTEAASAKLGTINNLVSTGAASTALNGCNTRQGSRYYQAIFRWIIWRCYYFFYNWLRKVKCRRLERLCMRRGEPFCSRYCKKCELPKLIGGIWWWLPIFTYEWYPVNPCLDRTQCVFQCPQCVIGTDPPTQDTTPTSGAVSTAQGRRAQFYKALLRKAKKIN